MEDGKKIAIFVNVFLYAIVLMIAVKIVDVDRIGPNMTKIGLSTVNNWFRNLWSYNETLGYSKVFYIISMILGIIALLAAGVWAGIGIFQYIKEKDINKVDKSIIATGGFYILLLIKYALIKGMSFNFSPVKLDGESAPKVSFPSGHTMLFIASMASTIYLVGYFLEKEEQKRIVLILRIICVAVMVLGITVRTLSGVCWLTDIIAGILLTVPTLIIYTFFCDV